MKSTRALPCGRHLFVLSILALAATATARGEVFSLRMQDEQNHPFIKIGGPNGVVLREATLLFHREDAPALIRSRLITFFACEALLMRREAHVEFLMRKARGESSMDTTLPRRALLVEVHPDNLVQALTAISRSGDGGPSGPPPPRVVIEQRVSGSESGQEEREEVCKFESACFSPASDASDQVKSSVSAKCGPFKVTFNSTGDMKYGVSAGPVSVSLGGRK